MSFCGWPVRAQTYQAQLERPDAPRPELDDVRGLARSGDVNVDTIPPAFASGFTPEEKELLGGSHLDVVDGDLTA